MAKQSLLKNSDEMDAPEIAEKIQAKMNEAFGNPSKPPIPEPKPEPISEPEPESEPEPTAEGEEPEADIAIPDNHYRALIHQGWSEDRISKINEADPDLLKELAEKAHKDVSQLSQQFSALGRKKLEFEKEHPPQPQPEPRQEPDVVKKLREEFPDNALADAVINLLEKSTPAPVAQPQPQAKRDQFEEDMAAIQTVNTFLGADDMKQFEDFYGSTQDGNGNPVWDWRSLTAGQTANRQALVKEADNILLGVELMGGQMSIPEALFRAHLIVSAPVQEKAIRGKIASQAKKREKGITLKPSGTKTPKTKQQKKTYEGAVVKTQERLDALFG